MTELTKDENITKLPEAIRNAIAVEKARAGDAQSLIDLALAKAGHTSGFIRDEQPVPYLPGKTDTIVHSEVRGHGDEWDIDYRKSWLGLQELKVRRLTTISGEKGSNFYLAIVTQNEESVEYPSPGVKITIPVGSYYYQEMGSGTEYIKGRNDPSVLGKINELLLSLK